MNKLIAEYEQQISTLSGLIEHYKIALKDARAKHRNIEAARIFRKIEVMKTEKAELEYAVREMKR